MVDGLVVGIELVRLRREWSLGGFDVAGRGAEAQRFLSALNDVVDVSVTVLEPYRICSLCNIGLTGKIFVEHWQTKDRAITAHCSCAFADYAHIIKHTIPSAAAHAVSESHAVMDSALLATLPPPQLPRLSCSCAPL